MKYTDEIITRYRESFGRQQAMHVAETEARRQKAISFAGELARVLCLDYGAKRVVLIGSTLDPDRYNESSDIDLVLFQMPPENYFHSVAACMNPDFTVDLIPYENAHELVKKALVTGKVVYEN
jgi:predicted nucleotidyltransferase